MHFTQNGPWLSVMMITGPTHNLLSVQLDEDAAGDHTSAEIEVMRSSNPARSMLDPIAVRAQVLAGVADGNKDFGTKYSVSKIRFVPDDSPPVEIYRFLAKGIVERLAQHRPFTNTNTLAPS